MGGNIMFWGPTAPHGQLQADVATDLLRFREHRSKLDFVRLASYGYEMIPLQKTV